MKKELLKEIKQLFPNEYSSKKFDYIPCIKDIVLLANVINRNIFNSKLNLSAIDFKIFNYGESNDDKGRFDLMVEKQNCGKILIFKSSDGDNFSQIVSVLCHEMIHAYDKCFGDMSNYIKSLLDKNINVKFHQVNQSQYLNGYDVHGKYFMKFVKKFNDFGIIVKVKYSAVDRMLMKKINEKLQKTKSDFLTKKGYQIDMSYFNTPFLDESEDDIEYKEKIEELYDGLKNCNKDLAYIDKDHWYISIA